MKTLLIVCFSLIVTLGQGQDFSAAQDSIMNEIKRTDYFENINLTTTGMNLFLAKKSVRYLAEEGDVSLYKSFFIADIADGELTLGRNIAFKTKEKKKAKATEGVQQLSNTSGKLWGLLTPVIKAKAEDNFAEIFSKGEFNEEISGGLKMTFFLGGSTFFDSAESSAKDTDGRFLKPSKQQKFMAQQRAYNFKKLEGDFEKEKEILSGTAALLGRHSQFSDDDIANLKGESSDEKNKEAIKAWYDAEVESFDSEDAHNAISAYWLSIWGNYTFVGSSLNVRDEVFGITTEVNFKGYDANIQYTYMFDGRKGLFYFSAGGGLVFQNSIATKQSIKKYDLNDYVQNIKPDTVQLVSVDDSEIYVGKYREYLSPKLFGQFVWLFPEFKLGDKTIWNKNFGLSLKLEKWTGAYDPINFTLGLPLMLPGKDSDKINLEIQFRWIDCTKEISSYTSDDRFIAGLNLAIPFSSVIY